MTSLLRKVLSPVLTWMLEPLICRVDDRLRLQILQLDARLARLDAALFPRLLPVVIKNELCNLEYLPRDILASCRRVHFVGYYANDAADQFSNATASSPLDSSAVHLAVSALGPNDAVAFLDEYHFRRFMETHWCSPSTTAGTLLIATRFELQSEDDCRHVLHSLGFMEIARTCRSHGGKPTGVTAVSHAEATTCAPRYLDRSPQDVPDDVGWLVVRRYPQHA
ncbi:MAG: hypothetical protein AW12_02515 [Candidatus Accumulibacter sp. BA-94]|jgi:hypothetical protein|uniref:hypothetical protein n=1 Tax=Accumulibacter sp. TaxID=2053492 RepID=UPI00044DFA61|nr:hypothetical protein [Accumulibacter sp.]EXI83877.1 MAG: hypothetical protein AW12_02515 [Candidatus Accumulibacter sp. BA-94]HRD86879.1 hypothetical protein [Accumulibacter sp.]